MRDSFWRGREFGSIPQMQDAAVAWCRDVAATRSCRPSGGASPASVFAAAEAGELLALPRKPFVLATWSTGTVGPDIHVKAGHSLYSVPWKALGHRVDIRSTAALVQVFDGGELIATHPFCERGKRTDMAHYPPEKIAFQMRTPTWCQRRSVEIGVATTAVIDGLLAVNALCRLRSAQGVLVLATKYDAARLESACAKAIDAGDPSYRTIKGILAAGLDHAAPDPAPAGDGGAAAFLHGPLQLFGNVVALPTTNATDNEHGSNEDSGVSA